jgi:very-short-patch-repair endonuclease
VSSPVRTLLDLAAVVSEPRLERLVNEADNLELIRSDDLRRDVARRGGEPGVVALRALLDPETFQLTDSDLEIRFLRLVRRAGLPPPETRTYVNGYKVDFYWPQLGLIVETDGLTYHRTAAQQARDRKRDQIHTAAGLTPLRFANAQVRSEDDRVVGTLASVARRLEAA